MHLCSDPIVLAVLQGFWDQHKALRLPAAAGDLTACARYIYQVSNEVRLGYRAKDYTCLIYTWLASTSWIDEPEIN